MEKGISKGHQKHAKLERLHYNKFHRNEWAILGAPCGIIKNLAEDIFEQIQQAAKYKLLFADEKHSDEIVEPGLDKLVKNQDRASISNWKDWNKYENAIFSNQFDACLINGNHFIANQQIVILHPKKKDSLSRKLDRLSNVQLFLSTDEQNEPYDYLKEHLKNWKSIPLFHISEVEKIAELITSGIQWPRLKALVLAGGKSVRMGQDKGKINYHGIDQREYLYDLLTNVVDDVYLSVREEQVSELEGMQTISDKLLGLGPFGAICSAFQSDPNAAWLVVPCDLPFLGLNQLKKLIANRNPSKYATAYLNQHTQFPEPLISIWEPKMYAQMLKFLSLGYSCPRKVLINSEVQLVQEKNQEFMRNVNTPEELNQVKKFLE